MGGTVIQGSVISIVRLPGSLLLMKEPVWRVLMEGCVWRVLTEDVCGGF